MPAVCPCFFNIFAATVHIWRPSLDPQIKDENAMVTGTHLYYLIVSSIINPLNAELNPIHHLLALVGARRVVNVSRIRVKLSGRTAP